jgi:hypothetical protein
MKDADHFRAQAVRCLALQRQAKRADVQKALQCLAREYEGEARALERRGTGGVARLPLAWPMLAMHRQVTALLRVSFAFWLSL